MSKRRTRKQKIKIQQRKNVYNKEIKLLEEEILELEQKIETHKNTNKKSIRNLKILGSVGNFITPLVVCSTLVGGVIYLLDGGLPFVKDEVDIIKRYTLSYEGNGDIEAYEHYESEDTDNLEKGELTMFFPCAVTDDSYQRIVRYYSGTELNSIDVYEAVLSENIEYINENLNEFEEEQIVTDYAPSNQDDYIIKAKLDFYDSSDYLTIPESDSNNIFFTSLDIIGSVGFFIFIHRQRNFRLFSSIKKINGNYKSEMQSLELMNNQLSEKQEKLLSLTMRGRKNDR